MAQCVVDNRCSSSRTFIYADLKLPTYCFFPSRFWVEGVAITVVGVIGLAGNFLAVLVLKDSPSSKSFDRLLIRFELFIDPNLCKVEIGSDQATWSTYVPMILCKQCALYICMPVSSYHPKANKLLWHFSLSTSLPSHLWPCRLELLPCITNRILQNFFLPSPRTFS